MDAFDRRLIAYRKAHGMTVPLPLSADCETRQHRDCQGKAINALTDRIDDCTCQCHKTPKGL
jgi:hypothetical protein